MNATTLIPLRCISINQAEGETANLTKVGCQTWEAASGHLSKIRDKAPKDGSYYKTDVVVTWADGMSVEIREDVANDGSYKPNLSKRIRDLWLFYGGLQKPGHMTEEQYEEFTKDKARRDAAIACLKTYSLEDVKAETVAPAAPVAATPVKTAAAFPTKEEFTRVVAIIGSMLQRAEDANARALKDAAVIRTVAMELRKSMAALIRAEDVA